MHRDLKPDNLLLESKESLEIKVADFGFSRKFDPNEGATLSLGTADFMAPELCGTGEVYNEKVDIWSIGIITYMLLTGERPWSAVDKKEIKREIRRADFDFYNDPFLEMTDDAIDFLK
jgi:serine/threonine protein kinase